MSRYIDIEPVISNTKAMKAVCDAISIDGIVKRLEEAPTAGVAPAVHGEWKLVSEHTTPAHFCSVCDRKALSHLAISLGKNVGYRIIEDLTNFCPFCGAKM